MATPTYTALATTTLSGSASSVTFSNIDQSYGDLVLVWDAEPDSTSGFIALRFNADSGSNYQNIIMYGTGSSAGSSTQTTSALYLQFSGNDKFWGYANIMDFTATDKHTTVIARQNNLNDGVSGIAGRWFDTSAINSVEVLAINGNYTAGSTFSLFGIAK